MRYLITYCSLILVLLAIGGCAANETRMPPVVPEPTGIEWHTSGQCDLVGVLRFGEAEDVVLIAVPPSFLCGRRQSL